MITIEPVTPSTWPGTLALLAATPMTASLPLAVERRGSEANAFPMLAGGQGVGIVAHEAGRVLGYVHGRLEPRRVVRDGGMASETLLYFGDLRVAPAARRRGLARRLLDGLADAAAGQGVARGFCLVNEGNDAMLRLLGSRSVRLAGESARSFVTATRLLVARPRVRRPMARVTPTRASLEPLARALAGRVLAPVVSSEGLLELARCAPEIAWIGDDSRVALAAWNQETRRRLRLLSPPASLRLATRTLHLVRRLNGAPAVGAGAGAAWRALEVSLVLDGADVATNAAALAALAFDGGAQLVNTISHGLEPGVAPLRLPGLVRRLRTHVVPFGIDAATPPAVPAHAHLHVDLGFL